jgi:biopolymer transport protein ExbD
MAKKKREIQEVNAGSMADIAFLLLVFFLVTTTMSQNQGVKATLPPFIENDKLEQIQYDQNNILEILVDKQDRLLVEGEMIKVTELREKSIEFLTNNGKDPKLSKNPQDAVISLRSDRGTSYEMYIKVQNELSAAYRTVRDEEGMKQFGETFTDIYERYKKFRNEKNLDKLNEEDKKTFSKMRKKLNAIKAVYPKKLSETEPEEVK